MHTLRVSQIHRKHPPATHRLQEAYHQLLTTEATRSNISSVVRSDANFQYILQCHRCFDKVFLCRLIEPLTDR
jgi:hypothetical protein